MRTPRDQSAAGLEKAEVRSSVFTLSMDGTCLRMRFGAWLTRRTPRMWSRTRTGRARWARTGGSGDPAPLRLGGAHAGRDSDRAWYQPGRGAQPPAPRAPAAAWRPRARGGAR